MTILRNRVCVVTVGGVQIDGLRVAFSVKKTTGKEPNTADVQITNLSRGSRAALSKTPRGTPVVLVAGYEANAAVIFSGDSRTIDHLKQGPEWATRIQCGDGERAYSLSHFAASFAPGASISDVILAAARSLGLNLGNLPDEVRKGSFRGGLTQFRHGYTAHGPAAAELDRLLRTVGLSWSIQDGALQVLRGGGPAPGDATLLTPETGLVGSPEHGAPDKKGGPSTLKVRSLLRPRIRCGGRIEVRSEGVNGQFRVEALTHAGDTHSNDWYTTVDAKPAP